MPKQPPEQLPEQLPKQMPKQLPKQPCKHNIIFWVILTCRKHNAEEWRECQTEQRKVPSQIL